MTPPLSDPILPVAVYVGFSGARHLLEPQGGSEVLKRDFEAQVEEYLFRRMQSLRGDLGLGARHFFCGISQVSIGGDTLFTHVCGRLEIPQRIFLPQHRDEYLNAVGSSQPDFSATEKARALALLSRPHVIQIQVVSEAAGRAERFQDAQLETVRISDVMVCLVRKDMVVRPGGTPELIELASKRGRPVLVIEVAEQEGKAVFKEIWHHRDVFQLPVLPAILSQAEPLETPQGDLPELLSYCGHLKAVGSRHADWQRTVFRKAAAIIIGTHILATVCAVLAVLLHGGGEGLIAAILGVELLLLLGGFFVHQYLHHSHASFGWAMSRTLAEIARSASAMGATPVYLDYLFSLPLPVELSAILRTVNVLHLRSSMKAAVATNWETRRDMYIAERLDGVESKGQIPYQKKVLARSNRGLSIAQRTFLACSAIAFLASLSKLTLVLAESHSGHLEQVLGALAITLPALAVGALSIAAAFDLEARVHTAREMLDFLEHQEKRLRRAASERETQRLLLETEARLLAETATWYSRRSFTGVA